MASRPVWQRLQDGRFTPLLSLAALLLLLRFPSLLFPQPSQLALSNAIQASRRPQVAKLADVLISISPDSSLHTPLIVTLGDANYIDSTRQLAYSLDKQGNHNPILVLCLDAACKDAFSNTNILVYNGYAASSVATAKLGIIVDLLELDISFLLIDSDVYLKRDKNVFDSMLPVQGDWDVQIQPDRRYGSLVNFGFVWIKSTPANKVFWQTVQAQYRRWPDWDQTALNRYLAAIETGHESHPAHIRVHRLDERNFVNYMLHDMRKEDEGASLPKLGNPPMVHLTCVETPWLKSFVAKQMDLWTDANQYFSRAPRLLLVPRLEGTYSELSKQMSVILYLARKLGRHVIMADKVKVIHPGNKYRGEQLVHEVFHMSDFGYYFVEPQYLQHRRDLDLIDLQPARVSLTGAQDIREILDRIAVIQNAQIVQLDGGISVSDELDPAPLCSSLIGTRGCLAVCGKAWYP